MLLDILNVGLLSDLLCHLDKSKAKQLERASKTVRVFFTGSVKKAFLDRLANFYTKGVRVTNGVYDIYTMHGNTHVQLHVSDPMPFFVIDGSRFFVYCLGRRFLENGQESGVCFRDLMRLDTVVGIWIRDMTMLHLRSGVGLVTVQYDIHLVVERSGDLPQLTLTLHPIRSG
jgi:hypothetical protein